MTPREVEVLELVSQGLRDKEIADAIGISSESDMLAVWACQSSGRPFIAP